MRRRAAARRPHAAAAFRLLCLCAAGGVVDGLRRDELPNVRSLLKHSPSDVKRARTGTSSDRASRITSPDTHPSLHCDAGFLSDLGPIPTKIHIAFKGGAAVLTRAASRNNACIREGIMMLMQQNPGWDMHIYDHDDMERYLRKKLSSEHYRLLDELHFIAKVDAFRLAIMYHVGGMYADVDRVHNVPLDHIMTPETRALLPVNHKVDFSQDFMMSAPGNPIFSRALSMNLKRLRAGGKRILDLGPETYFQAATAVLCGRSIGRMPGSRAWRAIKRALRASRHTSVFQEACKGPRNCSLITYRTGYGGHVPGVGCRFLDKQALYAAFGKSHWTKETGQELGRGQKKIPRVARLAK